MEKEKRWYMEGGGDGDDGRGEREMEMKMAISMSIEFFIDDKNFIHLILVITL